MYFSMFLALFNTAYATLDSGSLLQQFYKPAGLLGNSFGNPSVNATYDYVIVGAGLAGSVAATRIAEALPNMTVAVVEAGSFYEISNGNYSQIPFYSTKYVGPDPDDWQPLIDWGIVSEPEPGAAGKRFHYAQGKTLGGSSARNQQIYHREGATRGWYQAIANITGDDSYEWDSMYPFMRKSFSFTPPDYEFRASNATPNYTLSAFDTPGGPVHLSYPKYAQPISSYAASGYEAAGFEPIKGFLDGDLLGYGYLTFTIRQEDSTRSSAESAFLSPAATKTSLKIYQSCQARNLLFDYRKRATGVNVTAAGMKPFTLTARKEIIVSSGFIHSPQLLMVSGIGPRAELEKHNIPLIADIPGVGQNLRDTPNIGPLVHRTDIPDRNAFQRDPVAFDAATSQYLTNGSGPLSSGAGDFAGWEVFPMASTANLSQDTQKFLKSLPPDWPNAEYVMSGSSAALADPQSSDNYASIGVLMTSSASTGNVSLASADNVVPPVLHIGWLSDPVDRELAVVGLKRARAIMAGIPGLGEEVSPGVGVQTDEEILNWIQKEGVGAIHHGASTCAMGRDVGSGAVVDSKARVFGVKGLRVIDTSSLPFSAPGHTQGVTYAHAEKLAKDVVDAAIGLGE